MRNKIFFSIGVILFFCNAVSFAALDLRFTTDISMVPDPANAGNLVTFSVSWKNFGAAVDNMNIQGGVDGMTILNYTYPHLDSAVPQETRSFNWTATAGTHTVWFELDPGHTCGDSDYTNNRVERIITVGGSADLKPDLRIGHIGVSPAIFKSGSSVVLTFTVMNTGEAASAPCKLNISKGLGNLAFAVIDVPAIEAHGNVYVTYQWKVDCGIDLRAIVDPTNEIEEANDSNNITTKKMACELNVQTTAPAVPAFPREDPYGPDLTVRWMPDGADHGDNITINVEVENLSPIESKPCKLAFIHNNIVRFTQDIKRLKQNEKISISTTWLKKDTGEVKVWVDYKNTNVESNEKNNIAVRTF